MVSVSLFLFVFFLCFSFCFSVSVSLFLCIWEESTGVELPLTRVLMWPVFLCFCFSFFSVSVSISVSFSVSISVFLFLFLFFSVSVSISVSLFLCIWEESTGVELPLTGVLMWSETSLTCHNWAGNTQGPWELKAKFGPQRHEVLGTSKCCSARSVSGPSKTG